MTTGGNERAKSVVIFQSASSRPDVYTATPITEDALEGRTSRTAKITIYDGTTIVPIQSNRITTKVVNDKVNVTINTVGLGTPKNGKRFKVRVTDSNNKSKEFHLN